MQVRKMHKQGWSAVKTCLDTHTVFPSFYSIFIAYFFHSISSLFHLIAPSLCKSPRSSLAYTHTRGERRRFDSVERGYVLFSSLLHVPKEGPIIVASAQTPAGATPLQNLWKRHFPHSHRGGLRGISECRGMYLN